MSKLETKRIKNLEACRKYYLKNKDKIKERHKKWGIEYRIKNRDKINTKNRNWHRANGKKLRLKVLSCVSNKIKCCKCGFDDWRALQVDHINGGGNQERKAMKTGGRYGLMKVILEKPEKYQILCANCNWIKRYEKNETPKRDE